MSVQDLGAGPAPETPVRPATVPAEAAWSVENGEWELAPRDVGGRRDGVVRTWRADGTLAAEVGYRAGEREGAWRRFHPDGAVAREGRFEGGQAHGRMVAHGTDAPTTEPLQSCCVPPGAWELQHDYDRGHLTDVRWYDRAGVHILPSGAPHPARPAGLPPEARFEEGRDQWTVTAYDDNGQPHGVWKRWARDGVLRERDEYAAGKADGLWQRWGETGALEEESAWRAGQRGGAYRRVGVPPELFTDPRVHEERGAFERDQPVGAWTLLDAQGAVVCTRSLGAALDDAGLLASPALADVAVGAKDWAAQADRLAAEDRPAEALLAAARAAAAAHDAALLSERLARLALPRQPESALGLAGTLVARDGGGLSMVANGLPAGADAASLLRGLASLLDGRDRVALELVDAALLLSPDRADCHVTRALVLVHLGRPDDALADVQALPEDHVEQREFLTGYVRVIFPAFRFAPAAEPAIETHFTDVPDAVDQPLEKVVAAIQKYATRLGVLRAAVAARLPEGEAPSWLPPALPELLPDGPVALATWDFEEIVEPEEDDPDAGEPEPHPVAVDERVTVDAAASLPALMRQARRDWVGICWLCWAAGLDGVALPEALAPREELGAAAGMSIERLWRCRDKLITGGLRAMTQGVPGFVWEGIEIDLLPAVLAEIAADEYREMRAVFFWLCDQGVQSVWQDNLRAAD